MGMSADVNYEPSDYDYDRQKLRSNRMAYDKTNRGAIWKNTRKSKDTHPDFTGELNVEGVAYFFDAWKRRPDASENSPALSFTVKRKDKQPEQDAHNQAKSSGYQREPGSDDDQDFPF